MMNIEESNKIILDYQNKIKNYENKIMKFKYQNEISKIISDLKIFQIERWANFPNINVVKFYKFFTMEFKIKPTPKEIELFLDIKKKIIYNKELFKIELEDLNTISILDFKIKIAKNEIIKLINQISNIF